MGLEITPTSYVIINDDPQILKLYQNLGSTILAFPMVANPRFFENTPLADGVAKFVLFRIPNQISVTGVKFVMSVAGVYTADNYNGVGIYSVSGTTYTKIGATTDDGTIWKNTANTLATKAFASPPIVLAPGYYYVCALYNNSAETTAPLIFTADTIGNAALSANVIGGTNKLCGTIAAQTALPTPTQAGSGLTSSGGMLGFMLY